VCLEDSNPCVIHAAIFALGKLGPSDEGALLLRFLDSEEQHLQVAAVTALAQLDYKPAGPLLLRRLEAVCQLLGKHRSQLNLATRFLNALVTLEYREAIPTLVRIARDEVGLRGLAVQALIELRAAEAAPALVPLLQQLHDSCHEEKLCCRLLYMMTAVDYRFAMPTVRSFLAHRQPGIRCAALKAVSAWNDREAIDDVRAIAAHDVSAFVRPVGVTALADLAGIEALADLERFSTDANALVRSAKAEALGKLVSQTSEARAILSRMIGDEALAVARVAQEALLKAPEESPVATPCTERSPLPACLREQAPAARAYLQRWRSERPPEAIAAALDTLLEVLP
jgi:HEAT repeat protein